MTQDDIDKLRRGKAAALEKKTKYEFVEVALPARELEAASNARDWAWGADELLRELPAEDELARRRLRRLLRQILTDRQLQTVWLYYFGGKRFSEIARALHIDRKTATQAIFGKQRKGKRIGGALKRMWRKLKSKVPPNLGISIRPNCDGQV